MAGSIGNSVALMKASMNVLKLDKELLAFPIMSGFASMLVMASFIAPIVLTGAGDVFGGDESPADHGECLPPEVIAEA